MRELPKAFDPKQAQEKWYSFWEENGLFRPEKIPSSKGPFSIVIPPPNVTGVLHMGHALVNTLQDILVRWKRMLGFETLWVPGTDHAGIATQTVVERDLFAKTGKKKADFSREEFLEKIWEWKEKSEKQILSQLKKLGCSCDFSRLRFTMDEQCSLAVNTCFEKMFREGLVYRGDYLVNWDPVTQTALSDDEVEYEEKDSFLWYIRYKGQNGKSLTIATTRPETMLGDTAIAVNPKDPRYSSLVGEMLEVPLVGRKIPVIQDLFVDPEFGTGALKITPAHDFNDFEVAKRNDLPMINIMTESGHIEEGMYRGLSMEKAREKILQDLGDHLVKKEPYKLRVGISYRSKAIIQPYLSKQWFVDSSAFKEKLISAVKEKRVRLIPPHWEETYFHWIENLRDWCISRQLWWGHRIPVWYKGDKVVCYTGKGMPPQIDDSWTQESDVLDTWFSSALWPLSALGWPKNTEDLAKFYPTSTLVTGHDILFFWVARMILMGEYLSGQVPFQETFLHGLIYGKSYWKKGSLPVEYVSMEEKKTYDLGKDVPSDVESRWEKMSKSKGNVIDPLEIIEEYGTDACRFALCSSVTFARQIDLDRRRFEEYKNFANKLWNGARFVLMNLEDLSEKDLAEGLQRKIFHLEDQWILSVLNRAIQEVNRYFSAYAFDKAATRCYEFFWNDFCSNYVEIAKPILFGKEGAQKEKKEKQKLLVILLLSAIRLMHPIAPFVTEEIFSLLKEKFPSIQKSSADSYTEELTKSLQKSSCMIAPFPEVKETKDIDEEVENAFSFVYAIAKTLRNIRAEMQLSFSEKSDVYVISSDGKKMLSTKQQRILRSLVPISQLLFQKEEPKGFGASAVYGEGKLFIPIPETLKKKEKVRLEKEREKIEKLLQGAEKKLANREFLEKAPKQVVASLKSSFSDLQNQLSEIDAKLAKLA